MSGGDSRCGRDRGSNVARKKRPGGGTKPENESLVQDGYKPGYIFTKFITRYNLLGYHAELNPLARSHSPLARSHS